MPQAEENRPGRPCLQILHRLEPSACIGVNCIRDTRPSVIATTIYALLHRLHIENINMDNFLDSVTRKGRKVKERLSGKGGKRDKSGVNTAEGSIGSSSSVLRQVPHIAAGGHDGEGSRTSTDTRQVHSRGRSPQPESMPVGGREDDKEGREADPDEKEMSQGPSRPEPKVENVVGGGPDSTEVGAFSSSSSTPILLGGKSDST